MKKHAADLMPTYSLEPRPADLSQALPETELFYTMDKMKTKMCVALSHCTGF